LLFASNLDLGSDSPLLMAPILGAAAGVALGAGLGNAADRKLARGQPLRSGHRAALRVGTVLAGATTGAIVSFFLINPEGPGPFGADDGTIFAGSLAAGAALGALAQYHWEPALWPAARVGRRDGVWRVGVRTTW
jgi:hypothetical protein